jgi:hypothetical protein
MDGIDFLEPVNKSQGSQDGKSCARLSPGRVNDNNETSLFVRVDFICASMLHVIERE